MRICLRVFSVLGCGTLLWGQSSALQIVPRLTAGPILSAQEVAQLESAVQLNPDDEPSRVRLLQSYRDTAPIPPADDPTRRLARLRHILYLVEHHPDAPVLATPVAYVYKEKGPYANPADHDAVRNQWLLTVETRPANLRILLNAVQYLRVEDPDDAENVLRHALEVDPENHEIAANLGFLYASEILGRAGVPDPVVAEHASAELEQNFNAYVLAAAGTALPNQAVRTSAGRPVDPKVFELASKLLGRARQLAPGNPEIQGPMPMIRWFAATPPN